jgi:hypothetical protein
MQCAVCGVAAAAGERYRGGARREQSGVVAARFAKWVSEGNEGRGEERKWKMPSFQIPPIFIG